jgi:hypothetical protein
MLTFNHQVLLDMLELIFGLILLTSISTKDVAGSSKQYMGRGGDNFSIKRIPANSTTQSTFFK